MDGSLILISLLNGGALRDVDTVQELTDILVLDLGNVLDGGGALGNVLEVNTTENDLILLVGDVDGDSLQHGNAADNLLTNEVADLNALLLINNGQVDGEMGIGRAHLVLETLGNTLDHVLDVRADGANASQVLVATEPNGNLELVLSRAGNLQGDEGEVALKGSARTSNLDLAAGQINLD